LTDNGGSKHFLSEIYNQDWTGYNADYFVKNGYYVLSGVDGDGNGKIGCMWLDIIDNSGHFYGTKNIIFEDCPNPWEIPFRIQPYW